MSVPQRLSGEKALYALSCQAQAVTIMLQVEAKRYMASDIQVEKANEQNQDQSARSPGVLLGLLAVTAIAAFVYFNGLGNLPLFNPDEALYAEPAREMIVTG